MTPIQKAKEIAKQFYIWQFGQEYPIDEKLDKWLATPQAVALLSGEDWKEDGWISVDEKLPKKNEEYIVCGKGFDGRIVTTMEWKNKKWFSDVYQKYIQQIKITHWQPLPEPPKP